MRHTKVFPITDKGRDKNKRFLITEMTSSQGEAWAIRVLLALAASNVELPDELDNLSMATLAQMGMKALAGLHWAVAEPLLAEMMECVEILPDPKTQIHRAIIEEDIEEIATRFKLRTEVFKLHVDFLEAVAPFISRIKEAAAKPQPQPIKTSQE